MQSNYFFTKTILTITIEPKDQELSNLGVLFLEIVKSKNISDIVFDLKLFEILTTDDIKFIEQLVSILKLNNIRVVICNINVYSASILFHFIDNISFETALDIQSAMNVIKSK